MQLNCSVLNFRSCVNRQHTDSLRSQRGKLLKDQNLRLIQGEIKTIFTPNHLCLWFGLLFFSLLLAGVGLCNCLIIHLQAPIYPLLLAVYVAPFCETFHRIWNEPVAFKVSPPKGRSLFMVLFVCLSININPLGDECPYARAIWQLIVSSAELFHRWGW